jgi:hypothetical protein
MKKTLLPAILLAIVCALSACGKAETTADEPQVTTEQTAVAEMSETESVDGSIVSESGSVADYAGYYVLTSRTGNFPYESFEILVDGDDYIIFYSDNGFAMCSLDYSEQRALNGNPLMLTSFDIDDVEAKFAVEPFDQGGTKGLELLGQGDFEEVTATFELEDTTASGETESVISDIWTNLSASFVRDDSDQYNNGVIRLHYNGDDTVSFEIDLMEGNEGEEASTEVTYFGEMTIYEEDRASFETTDDDGERLIIFLGLNETDDGLAADVATTGVFEIYPDGHYVYVEDLE